MGASWHKCSDDASRPAALGSYLNAAEIKTRNPLYKGSAYSKKMYAEEINMK